MLALIPPTFAAARKTYFGFSIKWLKVGLYIADDFKDYLKANGIPSMIYYPIPIHKQKAYSDLVKIPVKLDITEWLTERVISLPIHTEMDKEQLNYIIESVKEFFKWK